jgi:1-acyl-sn-glycerol-3-phosphate acyltransferase
VETTQNGPVSILEITPTNRQKLEAQKICDIVFNRGKFFVWGLFFCIFVTNRIYVLELEMLGPVVLASKHNSGKAPILMLDCMISQVSGGL